MASIRGRLTPAQRSGISKVVCCQVTPPSRLRKKAERVGEPVPA
jgi:hypothetical protein